MNIFIRELKANRKALIIWCVCMFLFVLSGMGKYTAYSSGQAGGDVFNKMPFTLKVLLGIGAFDVTTMSGFYAFLFPYLEITTAIHAALLGASILAKEEWDKTTEFLMVKPVSRTTIITAKLLAALINIVVVNLVTFISSILMVSAYNKGEDITFEIFLFLCNMLIIQLIFFSLGLVLAAFLRKPKSAGSIATSILLGGFTISKITDFTDKLNLLNILSPFKYFNLEDIVYKNSLDMVVIMLCLGLITGFIFLSYYFYQRRDLNI